MDRLEGAARRFYHAEFELFDKITKISGTIKSFPKGESRKKACLKALAEISVDSIFYLPSNPESIIFEIDYSSASPMQRYYFILINLNLFCFLALQKLHF